MVKQDVNPKSAAFPVQILPRACARARGSHLVCAVLCARTENLPAPLTAAAPPDGAAMAPPSAGGASAMGAVEAAAAATAAVLD